MRPANDRMDVAGAVEDLERSSLVEIVRSASDGEEFLRTPLAAAVFGRRKLAVSVWRNAVEADSEFLQMFGAAKASDVSRGLGPRVEQIKRAILGATGEDEQTEEGIALLTYVAQSYPAAWLAVSDVNLAVGRHESAERAIERFLQSAPDDRGGWIRLAEVRRARADALGELQARVALAETTHATYAEAGRAAWLLNQQLRNGKLRLDGDEKSVLVTRIRRLLEDGAHSADATELSRLAWICLHLKDDGAAREWTIVGLRREPQNEYLQSLAKRLKIRNLL